MKYCPYCGAELIPGALSFCSECGKALPVPAERTMPQDQAPPSRQRKEKPPKERKPKAPHKSKPAPEPDQPNLDYDCLLYTSPHPQGAQAHRPGNHQKQQDTGHAEPLVV